MSETKMLQERLRSLAHPDAEAMADDKRLTLLIHAANDAADALDAKDALLREAGTEFRSLMLAYVNLMEIGRDRIISLGGNCDPVDMMERDDPALVKAHALLLKLTEATK